MTARKAETAADDRPIAHHYILVLAVEAALLLALAWLASHYR